MSQSRSSLFYMETTCISIYADENIPRYDLNSGAQDTMGLHDDVVVSTEFSQITGKLHCQF